MARLKGNTALLLKVEELGLPKSAVEGLKKHNIRDVAALTMAAENQIAVIPGLRKGSRGFAVLREKLARLELEIGCASEGSFRQYYDPRVFREMNICRYFEIPVPQYIEQAHQSMMTLKKAFTDCADPTIAKLPVNYYLMEEIHDTLLRHFQTAGQTNIAAGKGNPGPAPGLGS